MDDGKPYEATPSRLARARREGDVARSTQLAGLGAFGAAAIASAAILPLVAGSAKAALLAAVGVGRSGTGPYAELAVACAGIATAAGAGAISASIAQAGGLAVRPPSLKLERLDPGAGLRRIGSRETVFGGCRAAVVAAVALALVSVNVARTIVLGARGVAAPAAAGVALDAVRSIVGVLVVVGALFAALECGVERGRWLRRLRMSFAEVKRDHRESDGDPLLRSRRRQTHRSMIRGSLTRLPEASFVVTNPNHVAIALVYRPPAITVPKVIVRAIDAGAQRVKRTARALGIPVIENIGLARLLLAETEVDGYIPRAAYVAVAEIVAGLWRELELK